MSVQFPLLHPATPGFRSISIRPGNSVAISTSPFTGQQQVQAHQGQWWQADVQLPPIKQDTTADEWAAWLTGLRGQYGTFLLGDSSRKTPRGSCTDEFPTVYDSATSGMSITITGLTTSVNGIFKAGDYLQIGSSNLLKRSDDFSHADWSKASVTVTANAATSPIGTTTADLLAPSGTGQVIQSVSSSLVGGSYVFSVWIRSVSGTVSGSIYGWSENGSGHSLGVKAFTATTTWTRVETRFSPREIGPHDVFISISGSVYAWGAQVNLGLYADAYVPTTSATVSATPRLYKITKDVNSSSGASTLVEIWPRLREPIVSGQYIKYTNCVGLFRLAGEPSWSVDPAKIYDIGFSAVEAI